MYAHLFSFQILNHCARARERNFYFFMILNVSVTFVNDLNNPRSSCLLFLEFDAESYVLLFGNPNGMSHHKQKGLANTTADLFDPCGSITNISS